MLAQQQLSLDDELSLHMHSMVLTLSKTFLHYMATTGGTAEDVTNVYLRYSPTLRQKIVPYSASWHTLVQWIDCRLDEFRRHPPLVGLMEAALTKSKLVDAPIPVEVEHCSVCARVFTDFCEDITRSANYLFYLNSVHHASVS